MKAETHSPSSRFIMQPQLQGWVQEKPPYDNKYDQIGNGLLSGIYDGKITEAAAPEVFLYTASMVRDNRFAISNYPCVNYVMNIMYDNLQNQAMPLITMNAY